LLVMLGRAPSRFVHREDRSVENAITQRLQPQRRETCVRLARNDPAAAGTLVKKFEDDARVVIGVAVFGNQTGILPSGFCRRSGSAESLVSAVSIRISLSKPKSAVAIRTLRTNGDAGDERRIIIAAPHQA